MRAPSFLMDFRLYPKNNARRETANHEQKYINHWPSLGRRHGYGAIFIYTS